MTKYFLQQSQQTRARPHFTPVILVAWGKQNFLMDGMYVTSDNVIVIVNMDIIIWPSCGLPAGVQFLGFRIVVVMNRMSDSL